ncbi:acyl-CoA carboxylase subunit beta [Streptomonospora sediminis]
MTLAETSPTTAVDHRDPLIRMGRLFDPGTTAPLNEADESGARSARGSIAGRPAIAYCTDGAFKGGSLGSAGSQRIVDAIDLAVRERCPVIGLWHSGGARLADGVASMDGVGRMFAAMTAASGRVPQISVVLGPAAGAAAYGPALTDIVIMADSARLFVTGPDVVRQVTGEDIDVVSLGGPEPHGGKSGVAHVTAASADEAFDRARLLANLFADPGLIDLRSAEPPCDFADLLPQSPRRAYDVLPIIRRLLDPGRGGAAPFQELQPRWAPNVVIGLGRLAGRTVGVVANNPLRKGGCLDALSAEKAARFVRMCDALGVPLVVLVDVPGYLPGVTQEWNGVVRRGAKLLHAFAEASVPRVTLVTRKSYGGAYIAMNSRSLGATAVYAWPDAEVAVMSAEAAVGVLHRKTLAAASEAERGELRARLVAEHERESGGVQRALDLGVVDEVIAPERTRERLAHAVATAPGGRGHHGNVPL